MPLVLPAARTCTGSAFAGRACAGRQRGTRSRGSPLPCKFCIHADHHALHRPAGEGVFETIPIEADYTVGDMKLWLNFHKVRRPPCAASKSTPPCEAR
jgi:hypothetical protein